nr:PH domain-containing protein [Leucobacter exalbidus]
MLVAAATGYWAGTFAESWVNLLAGVGAGLVALLLGVMPILAWLARRTTVTTNRVISRKGVFVHERTEVSWNRVREVRTKRSVPQRLVRAGDIELFHDAESTVLHDVPNSSIVAEAMQELMERNFKRATRESPRFS